MRVDTVLTGSLAAVAAISRWNRIPRGGIGIAESVEEAGQKAALPSIRLQHEPGTEL